MGRTLRVFSSRKIYHVCSRTRRAKIWFLPTKEFELMFGAILARAAERHKIKLYGYSFLGNHFHLLIQGKKRSISKFMKDLKSAVAGAVKQHYGWDDGKLWNRRYDAEPVFEDQLVQKFCYTNANAVSSDLVEHAEEYTGLSGYRQAVTGEVPQYVWTNNAKYKKDKSRAGKGREVKREDYQTTYNLALTPLPVWKDLEEGERLERQREELRRFEHDCAKLRASEGRCVLGAKRLKEVRPGTIPKKSKKAPKPLCHTNCPKRRLDYRKFISDVAQQHREASKKFLKGAHDVLFPIWTFRPPGWLCET